MAKNIETIHALTTAEIARQVAGHNERRRQIVNERAALYAHALKNGSYVDTPAIDEDTRASREAAKALLNGFAPSFLSSPPPISRDRELSRELAAIDIVIKVLSDQSLAARAAEAVEWAEQNRDGLRALCHDLVLSAIRTDALETAFRERLDTCPVRVPMVNVVNAHSVSEIPINELEKTVLSQGVITQSEIRKARNVE